MFISLYLLGFWLTTVVVCLPTTNTTDSAAGPIFPGLLSRYQLYNGLTANVYFGHPLAPIGFYPKVIWESMAQAVSRDRRRRPYAGRDGSKAYDIWPRWTDGPAPGSFTLPSWPWRFSLTDQWGTCTQRHITAAMLGSIERLFYSLADDGRQPFHELSGTITGMKGQIFQFRLFQTGWKGTQPEKIRNIDATDLRALNYGRDVILGQTTPKDLIIFLGSSGSLFYYTLNRKDDQSKDRRDAHLLPVSQAELWTVAKPLDMIQGRPEYQTFVKNQLQPIFKTPYRFQRVILVDYTFRGSTILGIRQMLYDNNIWQGDVSYINIESSEDPHHAPILPHVRKMQPIAIDSWQETSGLLGGVIGRLVPHYPWFFWDVPPEFVPYPDMDGTPGLVQIIRENRLPGAMEEVANATSGSLSGNFTADYTSVMMNADLEDTSNSTSFVAAGNFTNLHGQSINGQPYPYPENIPRPPMVGYLCPGNLGADDTGGSDNSTDFESSNTTGVEAGDSAIPISIMSLAPAIQTAFATS